MSARHHESDAHNPAVSDLFHRLALELDALSELGARIERTLCERVTLGKLDGVCVQDMQQLDHMLQHIAALRDFLNVAAMAPGCGSRISIAQALEQVPLAQVRDRLAATAREKSPGAAPPRGLELF